MVAHFCSAVKHKVGFCLFAVVSPGVLTLPLLSVLSFGFVTAGRGYAVYQVSAAIAAKHWLKSNRLKRERNGLDDQEPRTPTATSAKITARVEENPEETLRLSKFSVQRFFASRLTISLLRPARTNRIAVRHRLALASLPTDFNDLPP